MEYLDFELRVGSRLEAGYPVTILRAPAGEAGATIELPRGDRALVQHLSAIETMRSVATLVRGAGGAERGVKIAAPPDEDMLGAAESVGRALFSTLLPPQVLVCYRRSLDMARAEGKRLRLRLRIEAPELAILPWEYLYDDGEGDYISLNRETPLTRYLEMGRPPETLHVAPPLRILGMVASPPGLPALDVAGEQQRMAAALEHLVEVGTVQLTWLEGQTWRALDTALSREDLSWQVFHFIGHGGYDGERDEGLLALVNEAGDAEYVAARQLGRLFARHEPLRLVVLNACEGARASEARLFSSTGAVLLQRGVPAVISMQYEISDRAALEFARNFYDALARRMPVDAAVTEARYYLSMTFRESAEWATPVLYMRSADGNLFDLHAPATLFAPAAGGPAQDIAESPSTLLARAAPAPSEQPGLPPPASSPLAPTTGESQRGLAILRRKVRQYWIEGVLENSLFQKVLIDLGLTRDAAAVTSPWASILETPGASGQPIPREHGIADVFDEEGCSLLILGEPGCGKTTTMLSLARALDARSSALLGAPVPVVFNLSSWAEPARAIGDWLVDELSSKYQIPKRVGGDWLRAGALLPLLDGLDELPRDRRAACVEAINAFTQETALTGTVVCCRSREYTDLPMRLALNAAVRLQPLDDEQVQAYLGMAGDRLAALGAALQRDSALRIDARSPLMLNLMARAYQDLAVDQVLRETGETTALRRKQLMDAYVQRMFRRALGRSP